MGTPDILHERGSEIAKLRLIGNWKGTFPVIIRHAHSMLISTSDLSVEQQSDVGEVPFPVLPVM